jgi:2-methylisocitrate lyase-like PEP mutase family enzyme
VITFDGDNSAAGRLRARLNEPGMLEGACVFDAMTTRLTERAGYELAVIGAGGTANFVHGLPDMGLLSLAEAMDNVGRITSVSDIPVIADLDDAGGTPSTIRRYTRMAERAGAAVLMLEDLDSAAKHRWSDELAGWDLSKGTLRPVAMAVAAIRTACAARADPSTIIMGRTDAYDIEGVDGMVRRAQAYAEAGAEMIVMTHVPHAGLTAEIVAAIPVPIVHMEVETPSLAERQRLADMGVRGLIYTLRPLLDAFFAFRDALEEIRADTMPRDSRSQWDRNRELLDAVDLQGWSNVR